MEALFKVFTVMVAAFLVILVCAAIFATITQWAWSGSVGQVFHLPDLTFSQAFWLNMLGGMIAKGSSSSSSSK